MFLDPSWEPKERDKRLEMQMGGWLVESHCWGIPDNDSMQTCEWCGRRYLSSLIVGDDFPLCPNNPILLKQKEAEENGGTDKDS